MSRYMKTTKNELILDEKTIIYHDASFEYITGEIELEASGISREEFVNRLVDIAIENQTSRFLNRKSGYVANISFLMEMSFL